MTFSNVFIISVLLGFLLCCFSLEKYKGTRSRHQCPNCGDRKSFVLYVDEDGQPLDMSVDVTTNPAADITKRLLLSIGNILSYAEKIGEMTLRLGWSQLFKRDENRSRSHFARFHWSLSRDL